MGKNPSKTLFAVLLIMIFVLPPASAFTINPSAVSSGFKNQQAQLNDILEKYGLNSTYMQKIKSGLSIKLPKPAYLMLPKRGPEPDGGAVISGYWFKWDEKSPNTPLPAKRAVRVPLITGDIAIVHVSNSGKIDSVSIIGANGKPSSHSYYEAIVNGRLYLFPVGVNMKKLDIELFDISYLAGYGYTIEEGLNSIPIIIEYNRNNIPVQTLASELKTKGVSEEKVLSSLGLIFASVNINKAADFMKYIEKASTIKKVYLNYKVTMTLLQSVPMIGAPKVWAMGYNGSGIKIAILDTGIDKNHPMLQGKVVVEKSFVEYPPSEINDTFDYVGHGTHVASTAAGKRWNTTIPIEGGSRVVVNKTFSTPVYNKVQIYLNDYEENDEIYYEYNFTLKLSSNGSLVTITGESKHVIGKPLNDTLAFDLDHDNVTDKFTKIYIYVYSSDDDTLGAAVQAYNTTSGKWETLYGYDHLGPGVAPGALLWNVKVLNKYGWGYTSWIINGILFAALGPDGKPNTGDEADVISMSLGADVPSDGSDPLSLAVDYASSLGVVVVVAAGNAGPGYRTVGIPASAKSAITVGAINKHYYLAWFSSRGPTLDMRIKPTVVAPGVAITAALPNNSFATWSGTSMATPHVSGSVALILQAFKEKYGIKLTPSQVKSILVETAMDLGYDPLEQGAGLIQDDKAVNATILVDPAIGNFMLHPNETTITPLTIMNLEDASKNVTIRGVIKNYITGETAAVFATNVTLEPGEKKTVMLSVPPLTSLKKGYYIMYVNYTDKYSGITYKGLYSITILNKLTINLTYTDGKPASWELFYILDKNATSYKEAVLYTYELYTNDNGTVTVYVPDGEYCIVWPVENASAPTFVIKDVEVTNDTSIVLYPTNVQPLTFDAGFNASYYEGFYTLRIEGAAGSLIVGSLSDLGGTTSKPVVYITPTDFSSEWRVKYVPASYTIEDSPYFYHMDIVINHTMTPMTVTPDYSNVAIRITDYATDGSPDWSGYFVQHLFNLNGFTGVSMSYAFPIDAPMRRYEIYTPESVVYTFYIEAVRGIAFVDEFMQYEPANQTSYWGYGLMPMQAPHVESFNFIGSSFLYTELGSDALGNQIWFDKGHLIVKFNDTVIFNDTVNDFAFIQYPSGNGTLNVTVTDYTGLSLSTNISGTALYSVVNGNLIGPNKFLVLLDRDTLSGTIVGDINNNIYGYIIILDSNYNNYNATQVNVTITDWMGRPAGISIYNLDTGVYAFAAHFPDFNSTGPVSMAISAGNTSAHQIRTTSSSNAFNAFVRVIYVGPEDTGANFQSIKAAVEKAYPYSIILVYPGIYNETTVLVNKPLTITAIDKTNMPVVNGTTTFVIADTFNVNITNINITATTTGILAVDVENLNLTNITVEAATNSTVSAYSGIALYNDTDFYLFNISVAGTAHGGIEIYNSTGMMQTIFSTNSAGAGLYLENSHVKLCCTLFANDYWGILANNSIVKVLGVTAYYTGEGLSLAGSTSLYGDFVRIINSHTGIAARDTSYANLEYVYLDGNDYGLITGGAGSLSLGYAEIKNSEIGVGLYNNIESSMVHLEDVNITNTTTYGVLATQSSHLELVNANLTNVGVVGILAIESSSILLTNVSINGTNWIGLGAYGTSSINATNLKVENVPWEAVLAAENSNVKLSKYYAESIGRGVGLIGRASVDLEGAFIIAPAYEGIIATENSSITGDGIKIESPGITGIHGFGYAHISVSNVTIEEPAWAGVALFQNSTGTLMDLTINRTSGTGIILLDNAQANVTEAIIINATWGVSAWGHSVIAMSHILIENSTWDGIVAFDQSQVYVDASTLFHNRRGLSAYGTATIDYHNGIIENNTEWGAGVFDAAYINAGNNYWGSPNGPYDPNLNPSGTGDAIAGNTDMINYSPWLNSPPSGVPTPI